ncbi:MAG: MoaD/ThiS family protein [Candidatus Caldarchaeum sp.]
MKLELFGPLRSLVGRKELTIHVEGKMKLREVLKTLSHEVKRHVVDDAGNVQPGILILVNGADVRYSSWLDTEVGDDDTVTLIPSIHGG